MASARTGGANHRSCAHGTLQVLTGDATIRNVGNAGRPCRRRVGARSQNLAPRHHRGQERRRHPLHASKRDFAGKLGLKLDFVQLKNDTIALKALLAGELDSYEGGAGGAMAAAARGADVKIVGCNWLAAPHGVYVRPGIASMADLKGKAVAVSTPGSFPEIFAKAAFEKAGIPAGQVRFAAMGSDADRYKALIAGVVDGAIISNEYVPISGKDGIRDLMPAAEVMPDFIRVCVEMTGKSLIARRHDAVRFIAAEI